MSRADFLRGFFLANGVEKFVAVKPQLTVNTND